MSPVAELLRMDRDSHLTESCFWSQIRELRRRYVALWWETATDTPVLGEAVSRRRQKQNARSCERLIDEVARDIEAYPDSELERRSWRAAVQRKVQLFGEQSLGWPRGYRDLLFADEFWESTTQFVHAAKAFDSRISMDDVTQALRNVWIANSIQMLLDLPVRLSSAIFAYSMLYPCTDNYLDDPLINHEAKARLNARLGQRLSGEALAPVNGHERQVFRLIDMIESEHRRAIYPEVFLGLLAIHRAQVKSLDQQGRRRSPYEHDLLSISVEKGGASVLADAYLVAGQLTLDEADFFFGYGVVLQLLDDLQDVRADRRSRHMTLFSQTVEAWHLDRLVSRLYHLMQRVLDDSPRFAAHRFWNCRDLIRRNCTFLLVGAVAEARELFSREFLARLQDRWCFDFSSLSGLRRAVRKRYQRTARSIRRRRQSASPLELLTT